MGICCPSYKNSYNSNIRDMQNNNIGIHNTDLYNWPGLIFRRGLPFNLSIPCEGINYFDEHNILIQIVATGFDEKIIQICKDTETSNYSDWKYKVVEFENITNKISICINSPSSAIIGKYLISILYNGKKVGNTEFLLFFNPWCPADEVYMPKKEDCEEYVLNDSTKIYMGTEDYIVPKNWDLAQFEPGCIEAAVILLSMMPTNNRSKATDVSRQLSALVNSNDDNGVVVGNWSGKYTDGTSPMAWNGSELILTKYAQSLRPVRYGQCWVFCGVLCTILRTIGIPTRCVTNYASLHDTDGSLKWEIYLDENFNPINNGGDSCWNFHCWNEAWMARKDIGRNYDGWQVLDATPQERSNGIFRVGPASVTAISKGQTTLPYDVGFVFAEVNADKVFYLLQKDGSFKQYMIRKNELGKKIITKKVNCDEANIITKFYKCHEEGTMSSLCDEEHNAMRESESRINRKISLKIDLPPHIYLTDDVRGTVTVKGLSGLDNSVLKVEALLVSYTGRNICRLFEKQETITSSEKRLQINIKRETLESAIFEEFPFIKVKAYCFDSKNDEMAVSDKIISVKTPDLELSEIPKTCKVDTPVTCTASILNTLNKPLTHVRLNVKFTDDKERKIKFRNINPGEKLIQNLLLVPKTVGLKKINVSLECKECCGFTNTSKFNAVL